MTPVVLTLDAPRDPAWVEARSVDEIETLVRDGHTVLVTPAALLGGGDTAGEAAELAAASVCAWLGARIFRTARPDAVRQALDMTDSLAGRRPPAVTRRGLA
ncbi:hypothetical protein [Sinosporangium siamense]|uniref:Uncharacterized protein n=1 Tax=Sinosporangium siamense TaxID=1367973 RepID=A0A919RG43_9ACTN|nr:hypothetical protein [Sinosporangium siamense]GII93097.1 hypothetical protein Ssi02_33280 [Sinosporangium siamense]